MSFNHELVANVRHALFGVVTSRAEAESICTRLGSRQEFLTSLIAGKMTHESLGWLQEEVAEIAESSVVSAATRRKEKDFPLRQQASVIELADVLKRLIETDASTTQPVAEQAYAALVRYGSLNLPGEEHIRYSLATNIR
jgi:hypothetical protein